MFEVKHIKRGFLEPHSLKRVALTCLFVLTFTVWAYGQRIQPRQLDPDLHITQYVHNVWESADGLPQNSVYALAQTNDGFLWVGTQEGLARFDGLEFTVYDKAGVNWLKSNDILALLKDRNGALWIGTSGGGLSWIHGNETRLYLKDELHSDLVKALFEDHEGNIWIGTISGGVSRFDGSSFQHYTTEEGLADDIILSITETSDGAIWLGTTSGLTRLKDGKFQTYTSSEGLPGDFIRALYPGKAGLWIGSDNGVAFFENEEIHSISLPADSCGKQISALHEDRSGALWIGTFDGGVCRLFNNKVSVFNTAHDLSHDQIRSFFTDFEGNLWIGTDGGGLNRLASGKFLPLTSKEGLVSDHTITVLEDRAGVLWVGTEGFGLNRIEKDQITLINEKNGLPSGYILSLHEDRAGVLWIGTHEGGLCKMANNRLTCYDTGNGLPSNNIWSLFSTNDGALWAGTDMGLVRYREGRFETFTRQDGLSSDWVTALHEDRSGNLWIGTFDAGLNILSPDGKFSVLNTDNGLTSNSILTLYRDREDALWIGTKEGGLCRLYHSSLSCYTKRDGLHNDAVLQILEDDQGFLWLGSAKGISRVRKADLLSFKEEDGQKIPSVIFGKADGLKSIEAVGGSQPNAWKSRDGRLWFATIKGIVSINPASISINEVIPPLVIESLLVNDKPIDLNLPIKLPPGSRNLEIHYTANSFIGAHRTTFQYKLEGYDEDWVDAGTRRSAFYTNLAPGHYSFQVMAKNADGTWNRTGATLAFVIDPFFYETWWFYLFLFLGTMALSYGFYDARIRYLQNREHVLQKMVDEQTEALRDKQKELEKQYARQLKLTDKVRSLASALTLAEQKERRRIAQILHDDLQQLLYGIQMKFRFLSEDVPPGYPGLQQQISRAYELVTRAITTTRRLTVDLSPLVLKGEDLTEALHWLRSQMEESHELKVEIIEHSPVSIASEDMRVLLFQLVRELLFNVVKHAGVKQAVVELNEQDGILRIQVCDHGAGFDVNNESSVPSDAGFGLISIRERLDLFDGQMHIDSNPGQGTKVTITVPVNTQTMQTNGQIPTLKYVR